MDKLPVFELRFYWAAWAGPARQMRHIFDEVSLDIRNLLVYACDDASGEVRTNVNPDKGERVARECFTAVGIDVDEQPEVADRHGIDAVPTIELLADDVSILRLVGARPKRAVRHAIIESIEKRGNIALSTNLKE